MKKASTKNSRDIMRDILSDHEVRLITRRVQKAIGSMVEGLPGAYGREIEDSVRFQAVATRLREARECIGMDIKFAAKLLRVPQYRLQHIEKCDVKKLDPCILQRYVVSLVQEKWFARWRKANRNLAARLALNAKPRGKWRRG